MFSPSTNFCALRQRSSLRRGCSRAQRFVCLTAHTDALAIHSLDLRRGLSRWCTCGVYKTSQGFSPFFFCCLRGVSLFFHRIEAVELLVASLFSDEAPLAPPSTGLAGFLRFLLLLAGHDWEAAPLVVDPQGELTATDREAAGEAFTRSRDRGKYPRLPIFTLFNVPPAVLFLYVWQR